MTLDDIVLCSAIDERVLNEHNNIVQGQFRVVDDKTVKSLRIALISGDPNGFNLACKVLMIMSPLQMSSFFSKQIESNFDSILKFTTTLKDSDDKGAGDLRRKIQSMNTLSIVKNTLVETNIINLKKTISTHDIKNPNSNSPEPRGLSPDVSNEPRSTQSDKSN